jgi:hypothetical protein
MAGNYHGGWIGAKGFPNTTHGRARGKRYSGAAEPADNRAALCECTPRVTVFSSADTGNSTKNSGKSTRRVTAGNFGPH